MPEQESYVVATAERVFADLADPQSVIQLRNDSWRAPAWAALLETGLPLAWVPEVLGGPDVPLDEGFAILRASGRVALALPLAEAMLGAWMLAQAGITPPPEAASIVPSGPHDQILVGRDGRLAGKATCVAIATEIERLAVLVASNEGPHVALVRTTDCRINGRPNLAGELRASIDFDGVFPLAYAKAPAGLNHAAVLRMGAAVRAQQIAGALERMLEISVRYATERIAFGKPIGQFQAVQHNLAKLGGEVAASVAAAVSAADAILHEGLASDASILEISAAKIRCGQAAEVGAAIAHQVHGAIGFTDEHVLHRFSLRALSWRDDFGNEVFWSTELGSMVARVGARGLWPLLASR
ncbi:acyl-CoA dehydrogenase family protein [Bradyrhizobium vignae]|uniref:acyl-CoA dehydrogenase family protein n=1 Tax=Bradyrhizobium vignae TaxID=1549949 RepID=UPI00100BE2C2|nr:acyl-CoA dehydrogenase family protein [Bradyrhizobium vignae]RXH06665.1 acyl-CoA dehydrogenase [Bradyrhizobium vignae]